MSGNGQLGDTITGYYEPVLHGDVKQTAKARFPIYGVPTYFVSVDLPAESAQTARPGAGAANRPQ